MATTLTALHNSSAITISRNLDISSTFWTERLNHVRSQSSGGAVLSFSAGPNMLHGVLVFRYVDKAEAAILTAWIRDTIIFGLKPFSISANSWDDIGLGNGVALSWVKLDSDASTEKIAVRNGAGNKWTITIPYVAKLVGGGLGQC